MLKTAVRIAKQSEQIKRQLVILHNDMKSDIDHVHTRKQKKHASEIAKRKRSRLYIDNKGKIEKESTSICQKCGGRSHFAKECLISKVACHSCQKIGHYTKVRNSR